MGHLESKLKYHINKLNIETEAKAVRNDYLSLYLIFTELGSHFRL